MSTSNAISTPDNYKNYKNFTGDLIHFEIEMFVST